MVCGNGVQLGLDPCDLLFWQFGGAVCTFDDHLA